MANRRFDLLLLLFAFSRSGCAYSPVYLAERPFLAKQLPDGISMSDYVESGPYGTRISVAEKLAWLGARPGFDGKIHDFLGKEIIFWREPAWGIEPENSRGQKEAFETLPLRYHVIEMWRDPRLGYVQ